MNEKQLSNKVFVGNVPFQCTKDEFQECFKNLEGFETADIIKRYKSKLSRGFGFVVFKTEEQAQKLLDLKEMRLKDRTLRFSPYETSVKNDKSKQKHSIFVSNLENDTTHEQLKNIIANYGFTVSACFVNNKNGSTTGILIVESLEEYNKILLANIQHNGRSLELKPYIRNKRSNNGHNANARVAYREGFRAGHLIGFQQGFQQGQQHSKRKS